MTHTTDNHKFLVFNAFYRRRAEAVELVYSEDFRSPITRHRIYDKPDGYRVVSIWQEVSGKYPTESSWDLLVTIERKVL